MSRKSKSSAKKKWLIRVLLGLLVVFVGAIAIFLRFNPFSDARESTEEMSYGISTVVEGKVASTTLLSGTVAAVSEQYVYFDASKGKTATVLVAVGDQVTVGQQLVQYDKTAAQAEYDQALRSLNKIGRQINHLKTYGVPAATTTTHVNEETGESTQTTVAPTAQDTANYQQQLQDLNDSYSDAQVAVNKAKEALDATLVLSTVAGTVVKVDKDIDPSSKDSQTLVHIASEGQLQVKGTLTEYDLANLSVGQEVLLQSKVFDNKTFTGVISYISNYPTQSPASGGNEGASGSGATYAYKIELTGDVSELKQGFTVSVEVVNNNDFLLIPVSAAFREKEQDYVWVYDETTKRISKTAVTLGNADALSQEVVSGLSANQLVVTIADPSFKTGDKLPETFLENGSATGGETRD